MAAIPQTSCPLTRALPRNHFQGIYAITHAPSLDSTDAPLTKKNKKYGFAPAFRSQALVSLQKYMPP